MLEILFHLNLIVSLGFLLFFHYLFPLSLKKIKEAFCQLLSESLFLLLESNEFCDYQRSSDN